MAGNLQDHHTATFDGTFMQENVPSIVTNPKGRVTPLTRVTASLNLKRI